MPESETLTDEQTEGAFAQLASADPARAAMSDGGKAEALFQRIMALPAASNPPAWRRTPVVAGGAVAVAVIGIVATAAALNGGGSNNQVSPERTVETPDTGGGFAGMCAEMYSPEGLQRREWAFDGTVTSIDGFVATFEVQNWFKGGDTDTVSVEAGPLIGITSVGDDTVLQVGSRYLVSGDETFAWGCGFSQPYSDELAEEWDGLL